MITPEEMGEVTELYRSGLALRKIGVRYGVSAEAVRQRLVAAGVERRSTGARRGVPLVAPMERYLEVEESSMSLRERSDVHVKAIARAMSGAGFPVLPIGVRA